MLPLVLDSQKGWYSDTRIAG